MLPVTLRIVLCVAVLIYFILICIFLKNKVLELKYTLLWILTGICMAIMIFYPRALVCIIRLLGIDSLMNGLYLICIGFLFVLSMSLTSIVSKQNSKIRRLVQQSALLENRIQELENNNKEQKDEK